MTPRSGPPDTAIEMDRMSIASEDEEEMSRKQGDRFPANTDFEKTLVRKKRLAFCSLSLCLFGICCYYYKFGLFTDYEKAHPNG
ncbi:unnamed protein product [Caenorhabditis brenneri]